MDILRSPLFSLWNSIIRLFYSAKKVVKDGGKDDERRAEVEDEKAKHQTDLEHDVNKPQRTVQTMKDEYEKRLNEINRQSRMQADSHKEQVAQMQQYAQRDAEKYQRAMQAMKEEYERKLDEINRQSRMQADSHKEQVAQIQQDAQRDAEKHQRAMQAMKEGYERKLDEIYRQGQMQAASCNSQVAQMQQDGQPSECQQVANTHNEQKDLAELRAKLDAMGGEHNMLQALLSLHIIANQCFELINKFQESYDTMAEKKKAAKSVEALVSSNLLGSHLAKAELNDAEGAHRAMKDLLIPALHKLMTAFTSFSAATGSIQLRDASVGQVTTVIIDFEIHIRDLTDEVSKTSNMQIKEVKQHEVEMRLLLKELSDKLKPDANDRLEGLSTGPDGKIGQYPQTSTFRTPLSYLMPGNSLMFDVLTEMRLILPLLLLPFLWLPTSCTKVSCNHDRNSIYTMHPDDKLVGYQGFSALLECGVYYRYSWYYTNVLWEKDGRPIRTSSNDGKYRVLTKHHYNFENKAIEKGEEMIGSTFETIKKHGITDEDVKEGLYIKNLEPGDEGEYTCYLKGRSDCRTVISLKVKQIHHPTDLKFDEMPQKSLLECCSVSNMKAQSFCNYSTHIDPKSDLSSLSAWNAEYAVEYSWSYRAESIKPYAKTLINSEPDDADFVIFRNCLNHIPSEVQLPETIEKSSFMRTCCRNSFIPAACCVAPEDDEKTGNTTFAKCKKYIPLILSCHKLKFDASYVIFPPTEVSIRSTTHETMQICWRDTVAYKSPGIPDFNMTNSENSTEYSSYTLLNYTIFYKEVSKSLMAMSSDDTFFPLLLADSAITAPEADATNHDQTAIVQTLADLVTSAKNAGYDEKFTNNFMRKFSANLNKFHNISTNSTCGNMTNLRSNSTYLIYVIGHYKIEQMEVETIPSELVLGTTEDLKVDKLELADRLNRLCSSSITNKNCTFICNVTRKFTFEENLMLANGICRIDGNESKFRLPALFGIERQRECCNRKKVPAECMPLCTGQSLNQSDPFFQSCVALHLHAVYQCYQEHLDLLPPSFSSVSASDVTDTSAVLHWEWPADCDVCQNALCQITLYRSQNTREGTIHYRSTINLSSKRFNNLEPDTEYLAKMDSISNDVVKYYSFAKPSFVIFRTKVAKASHVCPLGGLPLQLEENMLVSCSRSNPCPEFYTCADSGYQSICCPKTVLNATMDFRKCCVKQEMNYGCAQYCTLEQSMPSYCKPYFKAYLICAAEATVRLGDSPQTHLIDSLASQYANRVRGVPLDIIFGCLFFGSLGYLIYSIYRLRDYQKRAALQTSFGNPIEQENKIVEVAGSDLLNASLQQYEQNETKDD